MKLHQNNLLKKFPESSLKILICCTSKQKREHYISALCQNLQKKGILNIIKLELMPGLQMSYLEPLPSNALSAFSDSSHFSYSISEVLHFLENKKIYVDDLWHFLKLAPDGCYHFGPPSKSDDLICCNPKLLITLLYLLRQLAEESNVPTSVIVSIESYPFQILKQFCILAQELHVLLPSCHQKLIWQEEFEDLFTYLSPQSLKFVTSNYP